MHLSSFVPLATHSARALFSQPSFCLHAPVVPLEAGVSTLAATVDSPLDGRCEAFMHFSDSAFLPIRFSFDTLLCNGQQINDFVIPRGVPNGDVEVIWQCTGLEPTCNRATISGGKADTSLPAEVEGRVGCVSELLLTKTTSAVVTRSTGTDIETFPVIVTASTTSYLPLIGKSSADGASHTNTKILNSQESNTSGPGGTDTTGPTTLVESTATNAVTTTEDVASSVTTFSITSASKDNEQSNSPDEEPTGGNGVFISSASRTTMPLTTILTMSLMSTLTVTKTVSATCTAT